jgi:Na+-transporting NADH:ubiquinone oxidoreductase subunit NqrB
MSVSGSCEVCATGEAQSTCDRCGKLVCEDHYDETTGYCTECASMVKEPGRVTQDNDEWRDGVDTHRM